MKLSTLVLFLIFSFQLKAQLPISHPFLQAYQKGTRDTSGAPGKKYWQNSAKYTLNINFNPSTRLLTGTVAIEYKNNSPDTLNEIWFKLYPNLYKKGVERNAEIKPSDIGDGVIITQFLANNQIIDLQKLLINGTNMHTNAVQIKPGKKIKFKINYSYTLNKDSHIRTGQVDSGAHFVAYFFPRIAVYDDIDGWNKFPYTGREEFYNDFCNFEANITVPKGFGVWATGDLTNAADVFSKTVADKLLKAEKSNEVIEVIDTKDLALGITRNYAYNTFTFKAKNVVDFAFATSNHYLWKSVSLVVDSGSKRRTRVDAVFNPQHKDYYEVIDFAKKTVEYMSFRFPKWPFPYKHETVFDGLDQMEYPMMVNDNPVQKREDAITLTSHEIFHTMFPFYMGINETKYGWMDEGWATIGEWLLSPMIDNDKFVDDYGVAQTAQFLGQPNDKPIITFTPDLTEIPFFVNSYPKPAMGYLYVKDYLGDALFYKALHYYFTKWKGKHPMPYDFFNCLNTGSGKNLNWFWKRWFFEIGIADMGIESVTKRITGAYIVKISNKGRLPLPIDLTVTYSDGSVEKFHESIEAWKNGNDSYPFQLKASTKKMIKIELGSSHVPDMNKNNNEYPLQ